MSSTLRRTLGVFLFLIAVIFSFPYTAHADTPCHTYTHEGSNQYYFESYESAEYVDGKLVLHFRLKTPYNDGRNTGFRFYTFKNTPNICDSTFHPYFFITLTPGMQNWSVRFVSSTRYEIWNDDTNTPEPCANCAGDLPNLDGVTEVAVQGFVDGGFPDQFLSTSFAPFIETTQECCSSVLFIPGMQGSRLIMENNVLWPPSLSLFSGDLLKLSLDEDGKSVNPVQVDGILNEFYSTPIYSGFSNFMDSLVSIDTQTGTSTIKEWQSLPYDWRYDPLHVVENGIDAVDGHVDPVAAIKSMAAHSDTGKVTIVAHSAGGLVGKVLIQKLAQQGKAGLIDSFVMVGSPQLGTPQAVAGLLHGGEQALPGGYILPGIIADPEVVREISKNMPGPHTLLPGSRYLDDILNPPVLFNENAGFTEDWVNAWGRSLDQYGEFAEFLTGATVPRVETYEGNLGSPSVLRVEKVLASKDFHDEFDSFVFPESIRVVQVAGWGLPTTKTIKYQNEHFSPGYRTLPTMEGDKTVVYPSAFASIGERYFFQLSLFNNEFSSDFSHRDLLSASAVQDVLKKIFGRQLIAENEFISKTKPPLSEIDTQLLVSSHSPVLLSAFDSQNRVTGIAVSQDSPSEFLFTSEEIPDSTFLVSGEANYLFLPKNETYQFFAKGIGTGPVTIEVQDFANDTPIDLAIFSDIPFSTTTDASFYVNVAQPQQTRVLIDIDRDGITNLYVASDADALTLEELLFNLKDIVDHLAVKDKLKKQLLKKIEGLEKKIAKSKQKKASKEIMKIEKAVVRKGVKGKLTEKEAEELLILLSQIEKAL